MKRIKSFFKKVFNPNIGYFIKPIVYPYEGRLRIGYKVCKGYIILGISGYTTRGYFVEKREAEECLKNLKRLKG